MPRVSTALLDQRVRRAATVLASGLLLHCGQASPATTTTDTAAAPIDATDAQDAVDPWAGAPPAICRSATASWSAGQTTFTDITLAADVSGVAGVRLSTADLTGDLYPDLTARRMIMGQRDAFVPGQRTLTLLRNNAASGTWTFQDITQDSHITQTRDGAQGRASHIVVYGDVDNDGDLDVFAGNSIPADPTKDLFPQDSSELMINDGTGQFSLTKTQTFADKKLLRKQLSSASFLDFDRDGKLDLFLGYTTWTNDSPVQNPLLQGDGQGGFVDATVAAGVQTQPLKTANIESGAAHRNTWGTAACDMNNDGWPDIMTVSYGRYFNGFFLNGQLGGSGNPFDDLRQEAHLDRDDNDDWTSNWNAQCWCHDNPSDDQCNTVPKPVVDCVQLKAAFGGQYRWNHATDRKPYRLGGNTGTAVCADLDRDGDLDLVEGTIVHPDVGPSSDPTRIIRNNGQKLPDFTHLHGEDTGLKHSWPTGQADDVGDMMVAVLDFDGDGRLDILVASSDYPGTHAMLFHQKVDGTYEEVPVDQGIDHKHAHGIAIADFDRDGDLDVVLGHSLMRCSLSPTECQPTEQIHVFRNDYKAHGNWVELQLLGGPLSNRAAIGARVQVTAGGQTQTFEVGGGHGHYGMQQDLVIHAGLGNSCEIDSIQVRWPDAAGTTETWQHVRANYLVRLEQGHGPTYPLAKTTK